MNIEEKIATEIRGLQGENGISWRELRPKVENIPFFEEVISDMLDTGDLYEPCLGHLKTVD